ncbi:hypothetical protein DPMN_083732 [Dreissena polymorpha]|uniref:Uncharacterized protein n=1 Tax=Dreissena polymorpha TaxID=45954 RepID=A0A9D3YAF4_DREPO|nr:hypothetical protein DPMN_083732 [Dreissena polymorpha]
MVVSNTSVHKKRKDLVKKQKANIDQVITRFVERGQLNGSDNRNKTIEVLGDNLDITIAPTHMTKDNQRKSLHWFLTMVKQRRVTYEDLHIEGPVPEQPCVTMIPSYKWLPSEENINFKFHVACVLMKYVDVFKPLIDSYPEYISNIFLEFTKQKSVILNTNLIDESENSTQRMIQIYKMYRT